MGTCLALHGAYVLAGERALALGDGGDGDVPRAQKLTPGAQGILHPSTTLGAWVFDTVCWLVYVSGVLKLASLFSGSPEPKEDERLPE
jgi:hypothetical protein